MPALCHAQLGLRLRLPRSSVCRLGSVSSARLGPQHAMPRPGFRVIVPGWNLRITSMWIVSGSAYSLYLFMTSSHCKGIPRLRSRNKPSVLVSVNEQGVQTARSFVLVQAGTSRRPGYLGSARFRKARGERMQEGQRTQRRAGRWVLDAYTGCEPSNATFATALERRGRGEHGPTSALLLNFGLRVTRSKILPKSRGTEDGEFL